MGLFKDVRKLQKQAKEISKDFDPAAQMRQAKEAMAAAGQMMEQQAAAAALAADGEAATAQVNAARDTVKVDPKSPGAVWIDWAHA